MYFKKRITKIAEEIVEKSNLPFKLDVLVVDNEAEEYEKYSFAFLHHVDSKRDINRVVIAWERVLWSYQFKTYKKVPEHSIEESIVIGVCHEIGHAIDPNIEKEGDVANLLREEIDLFLDQKINISEKEMLSNFQTYKKLVMKLEENAWENALQFLPETIELQIFEKTKEVCLKDYEENLSELEQKLMKKINKSEGI